jgi:hypothetical protein
MLRVYLDNDVTSAISRRACERAELAAVDQLLEWKRAGKIILDTSRQSPREMDRAPREHQDGLKEGLADLGMAPIDHQALGSYTLTDPYGGSICNPLVKDIVDESLYSDFLATGLGADDAKHLMYAVHNGYERFVTWDRHFINRRTILEKRCPAILIRKPSELVGELSKAGNNE